MKATGRFPFFARQMYASRCGNARVVTWGILQRRHQRSSHFACDRFGDDATVWPWLLHSLLPPVLADSTLTPLHGAPRLQAAHDKTTDQMIATQRWRCDPSLRRDLQDAMHMTAPVASCLYHW